MRARHSDVHSWIALSLCLAVLLQAVALLAVANQRGLRGITLELWVVSVTNLAALVIGGMAASGGRSQPLGLVAFVLPLLLLCAGPLSLWLRQLA